MATVDLGSSMPQWHIIELGGGESFRIQITPPDLNAYLAGNYHESIPEVLAVRFRCVTNWRDLFFERADGARMEMPFSVDALTALMREYPGLRDRLVELVGQQFHACHVAASNGNGEQPC